MTAAATVNSPPFEGQGGNIPFIPMQIIFSEHFIPVISMWLFLLLGDCRAMHSCGIQKHLSFFRRLRVKPAMTAFFNHYPINHYFIPSPLPSANPLFPQNVQIRTSKIVQNRTSNCTIPYINCTIPYIPFS
jgi:hypothetical protein